MALSEQEILAGLGEIVEEIVGTEPADVTPEKSLVDALDIDSLSLVEISVAATAHYAVQIPHDQPHDLHTTTHAITSLKQ